MHWFKKPNRSVNNSAFNFMEGQLPSKKILKKNPL